MKKKTNLIITAFISLSLCSCGKEKLYDVEVKVVEPTCMSEGYTEHKRNDGYVYRDTFVAKSDHHYKDLTIGGDDGIVYHICDVCGHLGYEISEETFDTNVEVNLDHLENLKKQITLLMIPIKKNLVG